MDRESRRKIIDSYKARRANGGVFAIRNSANGKSYVAATTDMQGSKNRFEFSQATGGCAFMPLQEDLKRYGKDVFSFEILEQLTQKEGQSDSDFKREAEELYRMVVESVEPEKLY
ncbi:MAG: GIY-YIG nuclease family protein [Burkholderiales bacterium]